MRQINAAFYLEVSSKTGYHIEAVSIYFTQIFNKASYILYKKYVANPSFRELVHPTTASGMTPNQPLPQVLKKNKEKGKKEKHCCH